MRGARVLVPVRARPSRFFRINWDRPAFFDRSEAAAGLLGLGVVRGYQRSPDPKAEASLFDQTDTPVSMSTTNSGELLPFNLKVRLV